MAEEKATPKINTAADMAQLRREGRILSSQELEELSTRVTALEEMAKLEDRFKILESRKRPRPITDMEGNQPKRQRQQRIPSTIKPESSESSSSETIHHTNKRRGYTRGIKTTPSYNLKLNSSLEEWGVWMHDMERIFEGDPDPYPKGSQKILKALDYLDPGLKSLWYTYTAKKRIRKWPVFLEWTRENIQGNKRRAAGRIAI